MGALKIGKTSLHFSREGATEKCQGRCGEILSSVFPDADTGLRLTRVDVCSPDSWAREQLLHGTVEALHTDMVFRDIFLYKPTTGKPALPWQTAKFNKGPWPLCLLLWSKLTEPLQLSMRSDFVCPALQKDGRRFSLRLHRKILPGRELAVQALRRGPRRKQKRRRRRRRRPSLARAVESSLGILLRRGHALYSPFLVSANPFLPCIGKEIAQFLATKGAKSKYRMQMTCSCASKAQRKTVWLPALPPCTGCSGVRYPLVGSLGRFIGRLAWPKKIG